MLHAILSRLIRQGTLTVRYIGRPDGPGSTNPWLAKYIFPGGYSPALSEVLPAVEHSGLLAIDVGILRGHYAHAIAHRRARFAGNRDAIASLYDERFCRMFEFYLAGCELAFNRMGHINWQLQVACRQDALPPTRDYMQDAERAVVAARLPAAPPRRGDPPPLAAFKRAPGLGLRGGTAGGACARPTSSRRRRTRRPAPAPKAAMRCRPRPRRRCRRRRPGSGRP